MYYLVYGIFYLFSLLPLWVLYLISDFTGLLLYYAIGYRKKVVRYNLQQAFPGITEKERERIAKKFYKNFSNNFIETIKLISASTTFIEKHFTGDFSLCNKFYEEGRKCELLTPHNFNWEMFFLKAPLSLKHKFLVVYLPMSSKIFEKMMSKVRTKTGTVMLPANQMREAIGPYRDEPYVLVLGADQNPGNLTTAYWVNFFGKPAPFARGPELQARKGNIPAVFCRFVKLRRGYYRVEFEMGEERPQALPGGELTIRYVRYLERVISEQPENWLWSHRRWRWDWKAEYGPVIGT